MRYIWENIVIVVYGRAMLHDESAYPDPFAFRPSRFMTGNVLDVDVRNPTVACFGFGRRRVCKVSHSKSADRKWDRICPGRQMAFSAIWIAVASIMYCFDIRKARDNYGNEIEPLDEISIGLTWCVLI